MDPTELGESREVKMASYRQARDQIVDHLKKRWRE
jgi:hypothetical protein